MTPFITVDKKYLAEVEDGWGGGGVEGKVRQVGGGG